MLTRRTFIGAIAPVAASGWSFLPSEDRSLSKWGKIRLLVDLFEYKMGNVFKVDLIFKDGLRKPAQIVKCTHNENDTVVWEVLLEEQVSQFIVCSPKGEDLATYQHYTRFANGEKSFKLTFGIGTSCLV